MIFGESAVVEVDLAYVSRGSKSRNKVSVGEPAEGSVPLWYVDIGLFGVHLALEITGLFCLVLYWLAL